MKRICITLGLLFTAMSFSSAQAVPAAPKWLEDAVFYQIYPQSYCDTNGDGIGDLNGITRKLDYIKSMGFNALWLNPIFDSPFFDAGYDIRDYYKVAPRYGTTQDLKRLFAEAHKRGIRVCLDLVPGHTSMDCDWFVQSAKKERNAYSDRYIWTTSDTILPNNKFVKNTLPRGGNFMKNFFDIQPALNFGYANPNPAHPWELPVTAEGPQKNRQEIFNIIDHWMAMGADGFRVDMAASLIKNDPGYVETNKLWRELRTKMQTKYPEGILLSEWGNPSESITAGFTMDFMVQLKNSGFRQLFFNFGTNNLIDTCYFDLRGKGDPTLFVTNLQKYMKDVKGKGYICLPTINHDRQRPRCLSRNTYDQLKTVMAFIFTMPTVPLVYYGDEIGMRYQFGLPNVEGSQFDMNRAGSRTPMQWTSARNAGFSTAPAEKLYLPIDNEDCIPTVESQWNDPNSLLNFVKALTTLHKQHSALKPSADIHFLLAKAKTYPIVYERKSKDETLLIAINPSGKKQSVTIDYPASGKKLIPLHVTKGTQIKHRNNQLVIESGAVSYAIYKLE